MLQGFGRQAPPRGPGQGSGRIRGGGEAASRPTGRAGLRPASRASRRGGWLGMAGSGCLPAGSGGRPGSGNVPAGGRVVSAGDPGRWWLPLAGRSSRFAAGTVTPTRAVGRCSDGDSGVVETGPLDGRPLTGKPESVACVPLDGRVGHAGALGRWWLPLYGTSSRFVNAAVMRAHSPGRRVDAIGEIVETGPLSGRPLTGDAVTGLERVARGG